MNITELQGLIFLGVLLSLSVACEVINDISMSKHLKDEIVSVVLFSFLNIPYKILLLLYRNAFSGRYLIPITKWCNSGMRLSVSQRVSHCSNEMYVCLCSSKPELSI